MDVFSKMFPTIIEEWLKTRLTENSFKKHTYYYLPKMRYSQKLSNKGQIQTFTSFWQQKNRTLAVSLHKPQSNKIFPVQS